MESLSRTIGRLEIFRRTGIQFLGFNTIYQLAAEKPETLRRAERLLMIADYFSHRLGARPVGEVTLAGTSQLVDARTRAWSLDLVEKLKLAQSPARLLPELVEPGTVLGDCEGIPVIATAAHDTAAAVAGCPGAGRDWAFLSSGTWSLLGVELPAPVITEAALEANLSNELGISGTTRLLKNICGLWPLQRCREEWAVAGRECSWNELISLAEKAAPWSAVIDPDDPRFVAPPGMLQAIAAFCRDTSQDPPQDIGQTVRMVLEGLALKCRRVLGKLEEVVGGSLSTIHMVGGGVQNRLLCQWTADACARRVVAGPVEATAVGNIVTQAMAVGAVDSLAEARRMIARSFQPAEYQPHPSSAWDDAYVRLQNIIPK
jgi:rhamnulokinase